MISMMPGAVYVFSRIGDNTWVQESYIKAITDTNAGELFGYSVSLDGGGRHPGGRRRFPRH